MTETEFALWIGIAGTALIAIGMGLIILVESGLAGTIITGAGAGLLGYASVMAAPR